MRYLVLSFICLVLSFQSNGQHRATISSNKNPVDSILIINADSTEYDIYSLKRQKCASLKVSSTQYSKDNRYKASNVQDGDSTTAWVPDPNKVRMGNFLNFEFDSTHHCPDVIKIVPGYSKSLQTWMDNNRLELLHIHLMDSTNESMQSLEFINAYCRYPLDSIDMRPQYFDLHEIHSKCQKIKDFKHLEIQINGVHEGTKYDDICISTIEFYRKSEKTGSISIEEYDKLNQK